MNNNADRRSLANLPSEILTFIVRDYLISTTEESEDPPFIHRASSKSFAEYGAEQDLDYTAILPAGCPISYGYFIAWKPTYHSGLCYRGRNASIEENSAIFRGIYSLASVNYELRQLCIEQTKNLARLAHERQESAYLKVLQVAEDYINLRIEQSSLPLSTLAQFIDVTDRGRAIGEDLSAQSHRLIDYERLSRILCLVARAWDESYTQPPVESMIERNGDILESIQNSNRRMGEAYLKAEAAGRTAGDYKKRLIERIAYEGAQLLEESGPVTQEGGEAFIKEKMRARGYFIFERFVPEQSLPLPPGAPGTECAGFFH